MEENNLQLNKEQNSQLPETLDVYKTNPLFRLRQKIRWLSPKKKLMFLALPFLAAAAGFILYFTLAAGSDPKINLVWTGNGTAINGTELHCGEQNKQFDIKIDGNAKDIVTVGAFITFDPAKITVTSIDVSKTDFPMGEESTTPTNPGTLQKIDNVNGLIQVIRAYPVSGSPGYGFTAASGILATIHFDVKADVIGQALFKLSQTDPSKTVIILNGGAATEPDNVGAESSLTIKCCIGDVCGANETCPSSNWQSEPDRCCNVDCVSATRLYLEPSKATVNVGQIIDKDGVDLLLFSERADISSVKVILTFDPNYLEISDIMGRDIVGNNIVGTIVAQTIVNAKITLEFSQYKGVKAQPNRLATLKFKVKNEKDLPSAPNQSLLSNPHQPYITKVQFEKNYGTGSTSSTNLFNAAGTPLFDANNPIIFTDGEYTIILPPIVLCAGTQLTVEPSYDSVKIHWCTEPASSCKITVSPFKGSPPPGGEDSDTNKREHYFKFTGLPQGDKYEYDISCDTENYYKLVLQKTFKTSKATDLSISQIRATDVAASKAKISWLTTGGKNSDGRSDSAVYYREEGTASWPYSNKNLALVTSHSLELVGLTPGTAYEYYAHSSVDGIANCAIDRATPDCAASKVFSFVTKNRNEAADANLILKVNHDRVCDEWLYCDAAVQILNTKKNPPRYEDVCFATGVCNALDKGGQCLSIVDKGQAVLTFNAPTSTSEIKNLSGYSKVGLNWGFRCAADGARKCSCSDPTVLSCQSPVCPGSDSECAAAKIDGYYPYSVMAEVGLPIGVPNPSFEEGTVRPWQSHNLAEVTNVSDPNDKTNRVMKIDPKGAYSGAEAEKLSNKIITTPGTLYVVSFRAKTDNFSGQKILVELGPYKTTGNDKTYSSFNYYDNESRKKTDIISLKSYWQEYVVSLIAEELVKQASGSISTDGPLNITIVREPTENSKDAFYVDNISMKSVLSVSNDLSYVPRSCRLYPSQNAPACDYYDVNRAKDMKGWKGYCVETDPGYGERKYLNQPMCLLWWPVDIISGESNIFSADSVAGYTDRKPLYYCLEARGNYGREDIQYCTTIDLEKACPVIDIRQAKGEKYQLGLNGVYTAFASDNGQQSRQTEDFFDNSRLQKDDIVGVGIIGGQINKFGSLLKNSSDNKDAEGYESWGWTSEEKNNWLYKYAENQYNYSDPFTTKVVCNPNGTGDFLALKLTFSTETQGLDSLEITSCDDDGQTVNTSVSIIFYLREPCLKIAQTVTVDGETIPWAQRINSQKITTDGWIGYTKDQDYSPFGGAVAPRPLNDPVNWENSGQPLFVEPADTLNMTSPYQVRGGSPYGIPGNAPTICSNIPSKNCLNNGDCLAAGKCGEKDVANNPANPNFLPYCASDLDYDLITANDCVDDNQCHDVLNNPDAVCYNFGFGRNQCGIPDQACLMLMGSIGYPCTSIQGECRLTVKDRQVGPASCVSGPNVGNNCQNRQNCGMEMDSGEYGMCVGFKAPKGVSWEDLNARLAVPGANNLSKLFAKSYGVWEWRRDTAGDQKYKYMASTTAVLDWDITGKGVLPQVPQILVNNSDKNNFVIITQGSAVLKFSSWVDPNQAPLTRYTVDWDDGKESVEAGLRIPGRDISNPHILVHYYKYIKSCENTDGVAGCDNCLDADHNNTCDQCVDDEAPTGEYEYCIYKPKIQLEDNWGRCNNDKDTNGNGQIDTDEACQNNSATWAQFKKQIVVYKDQGGMPTGVMSVEPTTLTYISDPDPANNFHLPHTDSFFVSNDTIAGGDLSWSLTVPSGSFLDSVDYKVNPVNGYTGVLGPDQSQEVKLTINNIDSLATGKYTAEIEVKDITNNKTEIVKIILQIGGSAL